MADSAQGGESFQQHSCRLARMQQLEEDLALQLQRKETFEQLIAHLLISVPNPMENEVVLHAISNAEEVERALTTMVTRIPSKHTHVKNFTHRMMRRRS